MHRSNLRKLAEMTPKYADTGAARSTASNIDYRAYKGACHQDKKSAPAWCYLVVLHNGKTPVY